MHARNGFPCFLGVLEEHGWLERAEREQVLSGDRRLRKRRSGHGTELVPPRAGVARETPVVPA